MPTPSDLRVLAALRHRGQCPALSVMVADDWRWQSVLEDLGVLVVRVQPGDHDADWSPLAGLAVILCQWRNVGAELAQAILAANPIRLELLDTRPNRIRSTVVWDGTGQPMTYRQRERRDFLLAKAWQAA
jgi:hypothetical protein